MYAYVICFVLPTYHTFTYISYLFFALPSLCRSRRARRKVRFMKEKQTFGTPPSLSSREGFALKKGPISMENHTRNRLVASELR